MKGLGSQYDECPSECQNAVKKFDVRRILLCDKCPKKYQKSVFKKNVEEALEVKLGNSRFNFNQLETAVHSVASLEELPRKDLTPNSGQLMGIYLTERAASRENT